MSRTIEANHERAEILSILETVLIEDLAWLEVNQYRAGKEERIHKSGRASSILEALRRLGYSEDALTFVRSRAKYDAEIGGAK